jgi:polyisoprenoid-binding protein YceI
VGQQLRLQTVGLTGNMAIVHQISYNIEPEADSRFAFQVAKTGVMRGKKHLFEFTRYSGKCLFCPGMPKESSIELAIVAESIVLKDAWIGRTDAKRVHKMATRNMLAVEEFPSLSFASSRICERAGSQFDVDGTLTLRAIAKPVHLTLHVEEHVGEGVRVSGHAGIKLTDYGLKPPSFLFGVIGTRDEIDVEFDLTGRPTGMRQPATCRPAVRRLTHFD